MSFVARIGNAIQTLSEVTVEWTVKDLPALSDKVNDHYESPVFSFVDCLWCIWLFPNSQIDEDVPECVGVYLFRMDSGPPKTIEYALECRCSNGVKKESGGERLFSTEGRDNGLGFDIVRYKLQEQDSTSLLDCVLNITCHLKCSEQNNAKVFRSDRALEVTRDLKTLLSNGNGSDFTLKLGDRGWPVHRAILECRSEYFANMFRHEWLENAAGEVMFGDLDEKAMDNVLQFIYSGDVEDLSPGNVCETYAAAHRFLLEGLKTLCVERMKETMCEELVFKALVLAETYGEKEVRQSTLECLVEKSRTIFDSEEWKEFKETRPSIVAALFEETMKSERRRLTDGRIVS